VVVEKPIWPAHAAARRRGHLSTPPVELTYARASPTFGQFNRPSGGVADRPSELSRKSRRPDLKDSTLHQYHADLERRLDRMLSHQPDKPASRRLFKAMRRDRDDLFRFVTRRDVPYTNNACERALRPSVIFRKVTGCFRSKWGAEVYAAAASVIATGRLHGLTALQAISNALAGKPVLLPP